MRVFDGFFNLPGLWQNPPPHFQRSFARAERLQSSPEGGIAVLGCELSRMIGMHPAIDGTPLPAPNKGEPQSGNDVLRHGLFAQVAPDHRAFRRAVLTGLSHSTVKAFAPRVPRARRTASRENWRNVPVRASISSRTSACQLRQNAGHSSPATAQTKRPIWLTRSNGSASSFRSNLTWPWPQMQTRQPNRCSHARQEWSRAQMAAPCIAWRTRSGMGAVRRWQRPFCSMPSTPLRSVLPECSQSFWTRLRTRKRWVTRYFLNRQSKKPSGWPPQRLSRAGRRVTAPA